MARNYLKSSTSIETPPNITIFVRPSSHNRSYLSTLAQCILPSTIPTGDRAPSRKWLSPPIDILCLASSSSRLLYLTYFDPCFVFPSRFSFSVLRRKHLWFNLGIYWTLIPKLQLATEDSTYWTHMPLIFPFLFYFISYNPRGS